MKKLFLLFSILVILIFCGSCGSRYSTEGMAIAADLPGDHIWKRAVAAKFTADNDPGRPRPGKLMERQIAKTPSKKLTGEYEVIFALSYDENGNEIRTFISAEKNGLPAEEEELNLGQANAETETPVLQNLDPFDPATQSRVYIKETDETLEINGIMTEAVDFLFLEKKILPIPGLPSLILKADFRSG
ncbi:hypothetical protein K7I13_11230 [Brucepastera parasyntrophica]|uniref:hypothetical protein n=1 Tax=Brucepastera parasyntrophica TaxID=2880008 RepID=UPI002109A70F|nr:hypothetical protein [Brucepastera parasyntrophica]ULQ59076.1 hypothetical protein K7I13_11230 [Brucepastera parasyntrophica]